MLHRSLTAQLGVLTVTFVVLATLQFVLGVLWEYTNARTPDHHVNVRLVEDILETIWSDPTATDEIPKLESIARVSAENPNFAYRLVVGDKSVTHGSVGEALWLPEVLQTVSQLQYPEKGNEHYVCSSGAMFRIPLPDRGRNAAVSAGNCADFYYYLELVGAEVSPFTRIEVFRHYTRRVSFRDYGGYLVVGFGVFLITLIVLYRAISRLRVVGIVAKSLDLNGKGVSLPESGLPLEVVPMVSALNEMIRRIEDFGEKQRFFVAAAAHELRTPLTILRTRLDDLPESEAKKQVSRGLQDMSRLVDRLLRLTEVRSTASIHSESLNLVDLVREACAGRAPPAIESRIEIEFRAPDSDVNIEGDAQMILTAVTNLLDNALSVSRTGDRIVVEVTSAGQVLVRDQGSGIPEGAELTIFEPFAKNPPNRKGHGLGLAIVRAIMMLHKGSAAVRNAPGGGAIFRLDFELEVPASG